MLECPRCHKVTLYSDDGLNALSRRDNKTYICDVCGDEEAMFDLGAKEPDQRELDFLAAIGKADGDDTG